MAYTNWSVTYLEVPTEAKWNQLGENDAGFNDGTNIDAGAIKKAHIDFGDGIHWEELGRHVLTSPGTTMTVSGMTPKRWLKVFVYVNTTNTVTAYMRFNNVSTNTYASRQSGNAGNDVITTSSSFINIIGSVLRRSWTVQDIVNIANQEKMVTGLRVDIPTTGAGNAPNRQEQVAKWSNTTDQITQIDVYSTSGNYDEDSELIVLGHD